MILFHKKRKFNLLFRLISFFVILAFSSFLTFSPRVTYAQSPLNLPAPGVLVSLSSVFRPLVIRGITISPENPFQFTFIVDEGDSEIKLLRTYVRSIRLFYISSLACPKSSFA